MITYGSHLAMRRTTPDDVEVLERLDFDADRHHGLRFGHGTPAPAERLRARWGGACLDERIILGQADGRVVGYAVLYNADLRSGHCWLGVIADPDEVGNGLGLLGAGMFITTMFDEWPLHKIYADVSADTLAQYASLLDDGCGVVEVVLAAHDVVADGTATDRRWISITRDRWEAGWGPRLRPQLAEAHGAIRRSDLSRTVRGSSPQ